MTVISLKLHHTL